ncbi:MAG: DM13 domain-containing protein [Anaerolineae bacterium]|nr:DM13 domain-containing protein [Anaerolineae bacterium]
MSRYIRWRLILMMALLLVLAGGTPVWLEFAEPLRPTEQEAKVFQCPEGLSEEQCALLAELDKEDEEKAVLFTNALLGEPVPAPANEQADDSIREGIEVETFSEFTETRIRTGEFSELDALRWAEGRVNIWEMVGDGEVTRVLRFDTTFEVSPGPELQVILAISSSPNSSEQLFDGDLAYSVGLLKGHVGGQNYLLPEDLDITQFSSVVIYSNSLDMIFSIAPLQQPIQ